MIFKPVLSSEYSRFPHRWPVQMSQPDDNKSKRTKKRATAKDEQGQTEEVRGGCGNEDSKVPRSRRFHPRPSSQVSAQTSDRKTEVPWLYANSRATFNIYTGWLSCWIFRVGGKPRQGWKSSKYSSHVLPTALAARFVRSSQPWTFVFQTEFGARDGSTKRYLYICNNCRFLRETIGTR